MSSLLRGGLTLPFALREWSANVPETLLEPTLRAGRLVALGHVPRRAIEATAEGFGEDVDALRAALDLHAETGADPVPMLERAAEMLERRGESQAAGRAAAAGAKLSGWMVGGLPLVSLPLLPMAHAPLFDPIGKAVLVLGSVLTTIGMIWMARLVPDPQPSDDPVALFADHVAAALAAGAALPWALDIAAKHAPGALRSSLSEARRRARLGQSWPAALDAVDAASFGGVVAALQRAERLGSPPTSALENSARARRVAADRAFERAVKRAPILMVLPLVLCVLPAFGLLAIVPFLRGIAFA